MKILITGGAGYIGSHIVVELIAAGYDPVIVDNFSNANPRVLKRLQELCGREIVCHNVDISDRDEIERVLRAEQPAAVIHLAGFKAVGESVDNPLKYYSNNVAGSVVLAQAMAAAGIRRVVFSSTATVYGPPKANPIPEQAPLAPVSPYPWTKLMIEQILRDLFQSDQRWSVSLLRYFNPVGAHSSGLIGEDSGDRPNNLMPYIAKVAVGKQPELKIFGGDYDTVDGTGRRDYLHVVDLARAHVAAMKQLLTQTGVVTYNLGRGESVSVLEMVAAFERASGRTIPYTIVNRRLGDIADFYADPALAERELGWRAERDLEDMCKDTWHFQSRNPDGYATQA
jgi:UDP-glucose 4-epimerase